MKMVALCSLMVARPTLLQLLLVGSRNSLVVLLVILVPLVSMVNVSGTND